VLSHRKISLPRDLLLVLGLFLTYRLLYSGLAWLAADAHIAFPQWALRHPTYQIRPLVVPDWSPLWEHLLDAWYRWDTGWYLKIAALGYDAADGSVGFQPLYPLLTRLVQPLVGGNYLLGGLLVSNLACLGAFGLFLSAAREELHDAPLARLALLLWAAFPAAFFLYAGYAESLYLVCALAAWLFARRERWGWAALAGALAALARVQGMLLCIPLGWLLAVRCTGADAAASREQVQALLESLRERPFWAALFHPSQAAAWLAALAPLLAYLGQNLWLRLSGLGSITAAYSNWNTAVVPPWKGFALMVDRLLHTPMMLTDWVELALFGAFILLTIAGSFRISPGFTLHNIALLAMVLMRGAYPGGLIPGFMRYTLAAFPLFFILAQVLQRPWQRALVTVVFLLLQALFVWAFLNWVWVA